MKSLRALPALLLAVAFGAGCSSTDNPVAQNGPDNATTYASSSGVQAEAQALPADEFEIDTYADGETAKTDMSDASFQVSAGGGATLDAEIDPRFWFRLIRSHERRFVVEFERPDTMTVIAHVRIVDRLLGTFNVATAPDTIEGIPVRGELIRKRLADTSVRKAVFKRHRIVRGDGDDANDDALDAEDGYRDGWSRWRLAAVSGAEITSDEGTRAIRSVRLQVGDRVDETFTDPLNLVRRGELLRLPPASPVHVTVTTGDPTDVVVLYARWGRMRLRPMADGTWQGRFLTPADGGLRHLAVNALSRGTLFDDALPYDSKAWALPYVVALPEPLATN